MSTPAKKWIGAALLDRNGEKLWLQSLLWKPWFIAAVLDLQKLLCWSRDRKKQYLLDQDS